MDAKRTSQEIDKEIQAERETIKKLQRELEATKKEHVAAEAVQSQLAYRALGAGDKTAQKALDEIEEKLTRAGNRIRSREKAIAEGMRRHAALQSEYERVYKAEQWEKVLALAAEAQKEAAEIDKHIDGFSKLLAAHGKRLEHLKNTAFNLGVERAFRTVGLRHVDRIFDWRLIQAGFAGEFEKPSEQYRKASGYAEILAEQIAAAQVSHDQAMKETEANGQGGNGHDPEIRPAEPEAEARTGAGRAEA